jgi:hypothetical protein
MVISDDAELRVVAERDEGVEVGGGYEAGRDHGLAQLLQGEAPSGAAGLTAAPHRCAPLADHMRETGVLELAHETTAVERSKLCRSAGTALWASTARATRALVSGPSRGSGTAETKSISSTSQPPA